MHADDVVDQLQRRVFVGDERIRRRWDKPDELSFTTQYYWYRARPATWAIASAAPVAEVVRVVAEAEESHQGDRTYGLLWLRDQADVVLLNEGRAMRELGRLVGRGIDPMAYAEVLAELYSGADVDYPVVAALSAPSQEQAGWLITDVPALLAQYPFIPADALGEPRVSVAGDVVTMRFWSHDYVLLEYESAINVREWQVVTRPDQPAEWTRTTTAELLIVPSGS
jgi:hypothetical protein